MNNTLTRKAVELFADYYNVPMSKVDAIPYEVPGIPRPQSDILAICQFANIVPTDLYENLNFIECLQYATRYKVDSVLDISKNRETFEFINNKLEDRVYLIKNEISPCDVAIYYLLRDLVAQLTFQEKEKYLHFSRWFNFIQQRPDIRKDYPIIPFFRSQMYS